MPSLRSALTDQFFLSYLIRTTVLLFSLFRPCPADDLIPGKELNQMQTATRVGETFQCPELSALTNGFGTITTGQTVKAVWYDFHNQIRSSEVKLPNKYLIAPEKFRLKSTNETELSYLRSAVQKLKTVDYLQVPPGNYEIHRSNSTQRTALSINGMTDKTLDFCGATVSMYDPMTFLNILNSKRITVRNLRIVHRYPLASLGYVEDNNGQYRLRITTPYIEALKSWPSEFQGIATIYQGHEDILTGSAPFMWRKNGSSFRLIDETLIKEGIESYDPATGIYQVRADHQLSREIKRLGEQGSPLLIKHYSHGTNGISAASSEDLTFEGIKFNGIPGMALYLADISSGILIRQCTVQANKIDDPLALFGSTADGFHSQVSKNVIIVGNHISDIGDDAINVYHGQFLGVVENLADKIKVKKLGGGAAISLSENMAIKIYSPNLTLKHDLITVTGIAGPNRLSAGDTTTLQLSQPAMNAVANKDFLTLHEGASERVFIAFNTIENGTARGILAQAKLVMIKANQIKHIARNAIKITSDTLWFHEAGLPENIKVLQNTIDNTTWDHLDWQPDTPSPSAINAAVEINPLERADGKPYGMAGSIKNLSVLNNRVSNVPTSFGYFGVQGLKAFSNLFSSTPNFLIQKKPGSQFNWTLTGPVFGEGSKDCQTDFAHSCQ